MFINSSPVFAESQLYNKLDLLHTISLINTPFRHLPLLNNSSFHDTIEAMRIGFDISPIVYNRGVSKYTRNLIRALKQLESHQLHLLGYSLRQYPTLEKFTAKYADKSYLYHVPPSLVETMCYTFNWPSVDHIFSHKVDVFHAWEEYVFPSRETPVVVTIHDVALLKFPEMAAASTIRKHQAAWDRLKQKNSHVIAVSQSTKKDIVELIGLDPRKVHLVYEALPTEHKIEMTKKEAEEIRAKLNIDKPYLLFVGVPEPRKNVPKLIQAWEKFKEEVDLVIAGHPFNDEDESLYKKGVHRISSATTQELVALYKGAEAMVLPSLYEGFGLPILEAFWFGCPVVTSKDTALSEIAGNAGILVDPHEVESIEQGIEKALHESKDKKEERQRSMKLRLQLFDWGQTARETVKVYRKAIEEMA